MADREPLVMADGNTRELPAGDNLLAMTGGAATIVVAASNASARIKAQADYVCDGTADEVEINAAITALPASGGNVLMSEGEFTTAAPVVIDRDNVTLAGICAGQPYNQSPSVRGGTLLLCHSSFSGAAVILVQRSGSAQSLACIALRDFTINGNAPASGDFDGVYYEARKGSIQRLFVYRARRDGMRFKAAVNEDCYDNLIWGNHVENALGSGLYFENRASDCLVRDNIVYNAGTNGITFENRASGHMVSGNYLYSCAGKGISAGTMHQMKFLFNRLQDLNGGLYITDNFTGSSGGLLVIGNTFRNCSKATDNTADAINIAPGIATIGGLIADNDFYTNAGLDNGGTAPNKYRARYGINISSSNMTNLVIGPNTYGYDAAQAQSAFGTDYLLDGGTSTFVLDPQRMVSTATVAFTDGDTVRRARIYDSRCTSTSKVSATVQRPNDSSSDFDLSANFERGVQGETISIADGGSLTAWDTVTTCDISGTVYPLYDSTHVLRINGTSAAKFQTNGTTAAFCEWTATSFGSVTTHYGRICLWMDAAPSGGTWIIRGRNSAGTKTFNIYVTSGRVLTIQDAGSNTQAFSTLIPLNKFVRIEWMCINSATVGQVEAKLWLDPFSTGAADETETSPASWNTLAETSRVNVGIITTPTAGPMWIDDIAISYSGYPGASQPPPDGFDIGYVYHANVVRVGDGYFDVLLSATDEGFEDVTEIPPNETLKLAYMLGS